MQSNTKCPLTIAVDARALIRRDLLGLEALGAVRSEFTHRNPKRAALERMGFYTGNVPATICTVENDDPYLSLPRGALPRLIELLEKLGHPVEKIVDRSLKLERLDLKLQRELRPYQVEAVAAMARAGNGILRGPPGSGKTVVLLGIIAELRQPTLVLVHTQALKEQWEARISEWLGMVPGSIGGGRKDNLRPITVGMLQTVCKRVREQPEIVGRFGCLITDETHHLPAETWYETINRFPAAYRIGASADERRKDGLEFLLYDAVGPVVHAIERTALVEDDHLVPLEMLLVKTGYCDEDYLGNVADGITPDWVSMISRLALDEERNARITSVVVRLLEENPRHRLLILSDRVQACVNLCRVIQALGHDCGLMLGGPENKDELERSIARLRTGTLRVAVGTKVADEGLDVPPLTHVLLTCPVHTHPKRLEQMAGRAARACEGKARAFCIYFWDELMFPHPAKDRLDRAKRIGRFRRALGQACASVEVWDPVTGRTERL